MSKKYPSFQFYPGDWLKDPSLRAVSSGARGLWIDMLCLMWETQPRGYLQTPSGAPLTDEQIARMTGNCSLEEVRGWLGELELLGVLSRTTQGVIYCRRLVRDEHKRSLCAEAGKRGGNPTLMGQSKGQSKGDAKGVPKRNPTPSSSFSTSRTSASADVEGCTETNAVASSSVPPSTGPPTEDVLMVFPCDGAVKTWALTRAQVERWRVAYPSLDIEAECRKALAWVEAHAERRKTARGMPQFLVRWFSRATNSPQRAFAASGNGRGSLPIGPGQRHEADAHREIGRF